MATDFQPVFQQKDLPIFSKLKPEDMTSTIQVLLDHNRQSIKQLLSATHFTWDNLLAPLEEMSNNLNKAWSSISHLHSVMESEALRKAYNDTLPLITAYHTELSQNQALFQAISSIAKDADFSKLSKAKQKIIENDLRDFTLSGIHLPEDKKNRMAELQLQLSQLMTRFSENVLDATHAWSLTIKDKAQLAGLPPQALQLAKQQAAALKVEGYALTLDYPSYSSAIMFLENRDLRKTIYTAYVTRASDCGDYAGKWDNTPIMEELLKVRHEIAQLVGFPHYAAYSLATKMAKTPEEVLAFLNELTTKSKVIAEQEYRELCEFAKARDAIDKLEVWDIAYYSEKLRESTFKFSQEDLRPYFPIDRVLSGLFAIVKQLYGLNIVKTEGIDVWHQDVAFYSIYDKNQKLRGGFYIDLYARAHKRDGAWMDECRNHHRLADGTIQYPVAYLTCNFMPATESHPALLTHEEVLTLFHEFGHCLQHLLTTVDIASIAGINGVPWDAVEFPSQLMEFFCWEQSCLALIAAHYQTGAALPDELYQKMLSAKHFHSGLQMIRQLEFSLFDFRLHLEYAADKSKQVQQLLNAVRQDTAVIHAPAFNRFQHSFSHIFAGSYAAGYYSYKWAEVLSADAYEQFAENNILDANTGAAFMRHILETGGVYDPMDCFIAFRGRRPKIDALLRQSGM
jgi:oligopeptidase A